MKINILIITWTRADYWILKPLILKMQKVNDFNVWLLVTWMHTLKKFWNSINLIKKDWINISEVVNISEKWTMLQWLSEEIIWIEKHLNNNIYDLILILWDRDEALAWAIVASHKKIPVAHIHWWDIWWHLPDEYIRNAITKFSHLHFTASKKCYKRILQMWENKKSIYNVWALCLDSIIWNNFYSKEYISKNLWLNLNKKWIILLQHPTISDINDFSYFKQINSSLDALNKVECEKIIIFPNSDSWSDIFINEINIYKNNNNYHIYKNLDRETFLSLLNHSDLLIWNSSSWIIESSWFNIPVINIWNRQKWREAGDNVVNISYNSDDILNSINKFLSNDYIKIWKINSPYFKWKTSNKIINIIKKINLKKLFNNKINYN